MTVAYRPSDRLHLWWLARCPRNVALRAAGERLGYPEKNHVLLVDASTQQWSLSPAFDVLPSGQALGYQQMRVGLDEADGTLENALSMCALFGLKKHEAVEEVRRVCHVLRGWRDHFTAVGVRPRDIESLAEQIERPFLAGQRDAYR
jgi:serine/threonine-protein kinase HipA